MEESYAVQPRMGNWAEFLGTIVNKTEQNLYGNGIKSKVQQDSNEIDHSNTVFDVV